MLLRSRHRFQQGKVTTNRDLKPMSRQDNEQTNNFNSQHEKGSCDQELEADNRNGVATCF